MIKKAIESYLKNGYAIIPSYLSKGECKQVINEINKLIDGYEVTEDKLTIFDTQNRKHDLDQYFKNSSSNISFFFQKKAFKNGKLLYSKQNSINKIGHALHQKNSLFSSLTYKTISAQLCQQLKQKQPLVIQSMAILKPPQIGGQVPDHQDSTFLYDQPETLVGFWIPLQDATLQNGCLWGIPGSHKGKLYKRHVIINGKAFDLTIHENDYKKEDFVPMEMKSGDLAIFSGRFVHRSNQNTSQHSRYAYTWHTRDKASHWSQTNWLQRKDYPSWPTK